MKSIAVFLLTCFIGSIVSEPISRANRIVGGYLATIHEYPFAAVVLFGDGFFRQWCGATVLSNRSVLSATHCTYNRQAREFRLRVGSSYAHSGGTVHVVAQILQHPHYNPSNLDSDINVMRSSTEIIIIPNLVEPARIPVRFYHLPDNTELWAAGWGYTSRTDTSSEQLRHVPVISINQNICRLRHGGITNNMLCAGWLDIGGRGQCYGDSGGPLLRDGVVVVGVTSFGAQNCGDPYFPIVNTRVSNYFNWIMANA